MYSRLWFRLFSCLISRIPAIIQKDKDGRDMMLVGNSKVFINTFLKTFLIRFPNQMVQIYTHTVHSDIFCPTQFTINSNRIKSISLPHLQLVDCRARNKITPTEPSPLLIPFISLLFRPDFTNRDCFLTAGY